MAARKNARKKKQPQPLFPKVPLDKAVVSDLLALLLVFLSALLVLAFLNLAGNLGEVIESWARRLLGYSAYLIPLVLGYFAAALFSKERTLLNAYSVTGAVVVFVALSGLFSLFTPDRTAAALTGTAGGYLGKWVDNLGGLFLKEPPMLIGLILLLAAGVAVMLNKTLLEIFSLKRGAKIGLDKVIVNEPSAAPPAKPARTKGTDDRTFEPNLTMPFDKDFKPFPLELLEDETREAKAGNVKASVEIIKRTLANFGIHVEMSEVNVGPTVTQYTLKPEEGVKLTSITALANDLSLALAAHPIRIEAPIPGKSLVGIEVPNQTKGLVRLKGVLSSPEYAKARGRLELPLGRSVAGETVTIDVTTLPHLLIAGQTNSGKSVAINSMLLSLVYRNSPRDLRLILVDPKRVELAAYEGVPHLLSPIIVEPEPAISALKWGILEMERRFKLFSEAKKRNIEEFNGSNKESYLPHILIVIDELATLMQTSQNEVEQSVIRLAQMSRATGIHLLLATQRPEANIITGLIKANIPARVAFAVASGVDSRIILDTSGAEKLLGKGDLLYQIAEMSRPRRVQGVFVSEKEIAAVTGYLKSEGETSYESEITTQPVRLGRKGMRVDEMDAPDDEMFAEAVEEVIRQGKASASLLQRRLRVGYARAARLLDLLEERGVIGPGEGAKGRDVLISDPSELERES